LVGLTAGAQAEFNLGIALLTKRLKIIGTVLRSRSISRKKPKRPRNLPKMSCRFLKAEKLKPNIDKIFKIEEIRAAHEYLESNASFGKVVLEF
jgi:NADPH:quinone reductase